MASLLAGPVLHGEFGQVGREDFSQFRFVEQSILGGPAKPGVEIQDAVTDNDKLATWSYGCCHRAPERVAFGS